MRLSLPPAPSYYALDDAWGTCAPLRGEVSVDVAVLGGGIAGCSAALHLAKRGYRVALLEARHIGYGASGRAGGQTIFGLAVGQQKLEREVGREDAHRLFDLSIEALDLTQSLILVSAGRAEAPGRPLWQRTAPVLSAWCIGASPGASQIPGDLLIMPPPTPNRR